MLSKSKLVALLLVGTAGASTCVGVLASLGPAGAASGPPSAYVTPGAGNPDTQLTVTTNGLCPAGDSNYDVSVSGAGVNTHPLIAGNEALPAAGATGYSTAVTETMGQFASEQSPAATLSGTYVIDFNCFATPTAIKPDESFPASITFSGSGSLDTNTYTNTVTALAASPSGSAPFGATVTLTATLTPPNAAGLVQFKNGATDLGSPVTVTNGTAVLKTSTLAIGSYSFTASFAASPTDTSGTWGSSTSSALPYTVVTPAPVFIPVVTGTVKVGSTVTCVQGALYAKSLFWSWFTGSGPITGAKSQTFKIPTTYAGRYIGCKLAASDPTGTTVGSSATVKVAA